MQRDSAAKIVSRFLGVYDEINKKQKEDAQRNLSLSPLSVATVKKYLAKLQNYKQEAFMTIKNAEASPVDQKLVLPISAFEFIDSRRSPETGSKSQADAALSEEALDRVRSSIIFD